MTITTEEFLSHYGVPGMKWGVRKTRGERTPEEAAARSARNKKIVKGAAVAAVVGVAVATVIVKRNASVKINTLPKVNDVGLFGSKSNATSPKSFWAPKDLNVKTSPGIFGNPAKMADFAKTKVSDIPKASTSYERDRIPTEMAKRSREVNKELRSWYNESSTPIKDRWYMGDDQ